MFSVSCDPRTVLLSLSQTAHTPLLDGLAMGIIEAVIECIFLVECVAEVIVEVQLPLGDPEMHAKQWREGNVST